MTAVPGIADVHLQQITDLPDLRLNVDRIRLSEMGLTQQDVAGSLLVSLSSTNQVAPNFWINPENRVNYRVAVQTPEHRIHSVDTLMSTPIIQGQAASGLAAQGGRVRGTSAQSTQLLGNLAVLSRGTQAANINHSTSSRPTTSTPAFRAVTSGPSRDVQKTDAAQRTATRQLVIRAKWRA